MKNFREDNFGKKEDLCKFHSCNPYLLVYPNIVFLEECPSIPVSNTEVSTYSKFDILFVAHLFSFFFLLSMLITCRNLNGRVGCYVEPSIRLFHFHHPRNLNPSPEMLETQHNVTGIVELMRHKIFCADPRTCIISRMV